MMAVNQSITTVCQETGKYIVSRCRKIHFFPCLIFQWQLIASCLPYDQFTALSIRISRSCESSVWRSNVFPAAVLVHFGQGHSSQILSSIDIPGHLFSLQSSFTPSPNGCCAFFLENLIILMGFCFVLFCILFAGSREQFELVRRGGQK